MTDRPVVAVVGAVNVDLVLPVDEIPKPGETVLGGRLSRFGGGKGANAAVAAARAGAAVSLVAAVGDDDYGRTAIEELNRDGVDCRTVAVYPDDVTGVALILVSPGGENVIAVAPGANSSLRPPTVRRALQSIEGLDCVLASSEVPLEVVLAAAEEASAAGVPFVLNPAPVREGIQKVFGYGPIVTPNRSECAQLAALVGHAGTGVVEDARAIVDLTGAPVVATLGKEGAMVLEPGAEPESIPARAVEAVDSTGAGDTFNGVLAVGLASRLALARAAARAATAASLSVRSWGARTGMPTAEEIESEIQNAAGA